MVFTSFIQMQRSKVNLTVGTILIGVATFVSSASLVKMLRASPPPELLEQLIAGATLFRISLVVLGIFVIALAPMFKKQPRSNYKANTDNSRTKNNVALLALILLTSFVLRIYQLSNGLWLDEILTYVNYAHLPFGEIITTYDSQNQHFLYSLLAHASFFIFGESGWALRLPAVLFGVSSIWALYLLGREVTSSHEALFSCALLAFSYHHIWFSQNARGYTGLLFWTILASWLFVRGLREGLPQLWLLYATTAALGSYTHITMIFVVMGHFLIYGITLFVKRGDKWTGKWTIFFLGFCLAGILTIQLYAFVLPQMFGGTIGQGRVVTEWKNPVWTLLEIVRGMQIGFKGIIPALFALVIFAFGSWSFAHSNPIVIGLLFIPALLCGLAAVGMGHHLWPRLFFFTLGFGALIVVRGTMEVGRVLLSFFRLKSIRAASLGTALCSLLLLASATTIPAAYLPKQDYWGAVGFLAKNKRPGDVIVTVGAAVFPYKKFYGVDWQEVEDAEGLNTMRTQAQRIWLTYTLPVHMKAMYPEIMTIIKNDFRIVRKFYGTLNGGTIFVCLYDNSK
jgi:hypothetical protein